LILIDVAAGGRIALDAANHFRLGHELIIWRTELSVNQVRAAQTAGHVKWGRS
jgi:hypothetical protein